MEVRKEGLPFFMKLGCDNICFAPSYNGKREGSAVGLRCKTPPTCSVTYRL